jgi:hypothetical protein
MSGTEIIRRYANGLPLYYKGNKILKLENRNYSNKSKSSCDVFRVWTESAYDWTLALDNEITDEE